ncbi:MAG: DNA starvation/stationary phase protection protein [Bernardetiaceae bacterium]|jgi:starvation-inducible DNA-binding protein|nr:DNA starvation/stationary phase protection protein [Bernardetiaceae bacterium]
MTAHIGIAEEHLKAVALSLNKLLADEFVLYTQTRNYHWNVEGPGFHAMHKFYEEQYEQLDEMMDSVAERVRALGHYAEGRLADFSALTRLTEPTTTNDINTQLRHLLNAHETIIRTLRADITTFAETHKDLGTSDFVTGLMEDHEKMAWMLRAFLK